MLGRINGRAARVKIESIDILECFKELWRSNDICHEFGEFINSRLSHPQ